MTDNNKIFAGIVIGLFAGAMMIMVLVVLKTTGVIP